MKVWSGNPVDWVAGDRPASVTIGVLDGVHRGHRSLLTRLDPALAKTVLTFDPHPVEVLRPGTHPRLLTTIEERIELLADCGVEQVGILDLAYIRELDPRRFVEDILVGRVAMAHIVSGPDFRFGHDRTGDTALLVEIGPTLGFTAEQIELVADDRGVVSSSRIRQMVEESQVEEAAMALESMFRVTGVVIHGDRRGTQLGFPTANVEPPSRKVIPGTGVYAGRARVDGRTHTAAINVGVRPTFGEGRLLIEAHLLDFEDDIYDEAIVIEFSSFIRPEARFDDAAGLVAQMRDDVEQTRALIPPSAG